MEIIAHADALLVSTDSLFGFLHAKQIVDLAARYKIPAVYPSAETSTPAA